MIMKVSAFQRMVHIQLIDMTALIVIGKDTHFCRIRISANRYIRSLYLVNIINTITIGMGDKQIFALTMITSLGVCFGKNSDMQSLRWV